MKDKLLELYSVNGVLRHECKDELLASLALSKRALNDERFALILLRAAADYFSHFDDKDLDEAIRDFFSAIKDAIPSFRETNRTLKKIMMRELGAS